MSIVSKEKRSPLGQLGFLDIEQRLSPTVARQLDLQLHDCLQFHLQLSRTAEMPAARRHAMLVELCQLGRRVVVFTGLAGRTPAKTLAPVLTGPGDRTPPDASSPVLDEHATADIVEDLGHLARVRLWTTQSEQIFDLLTRLYADRASGHLGQAMLRLEKGHFREADALFSTVRRLAPDHEQAMLGLGMLHLLAGRYGATVDCLSPLREIDSESGRTARAMLSFPELRSYL